MKTENEAEEDERANTQERAKKRRTAGDSPNDNSESSSTGQPAPAAATERDGRRVPAFGSTGAGAGGASSQQVGALDHSGTCRVLCCLSSKGCDVVHSLGVNYQTSAGVVAVSGYPVATRLSSQTQTNRSAVPNRA